MHAFSRGWSASIALAALAVGGCAHKTVEHPATSASVQPAPSRARPMPPGGAPDGLALPPEDGKGGYRTVNSDLSDAEAAWHLRAALNVAALSCDRSGTRGIATAYNRMLGQQRKTLATAYRTETARFGSANAADAHITQVYNFFAQPPVQARFCAAATKVATEAAATPPESFGTYASGALNRLTQPFDAFYHDYARYRIDLAAWQKGDAPRAEMRMAAVAPVPAQAQAAGPPWRIQLGAYSGDRAAHDAWGRISSRMRGATDFEPRYEEVPGGPLVRIRIGPVSDRTQAIALCAAAAGAGLDCLPVPPKA